VLWGDPGLLMLQPPLVEVDMLNRAAFERAIQAGYEYPIRRLEELPADSPVLRSGRTL